MDLSIPKELHHIVFAYIAAIQEGYNFFLWNAYNIFKMKETICLISKDWNEIGKDVTTTLLNTLIQDNLFHPDKNNIPQTLQNFIKICYNVPIKDIIIPSEIVDNCLGIKLFGKTGIVLSQNLFWTIQDFCRICKNLGNPFLIMNNNETFSLKLRLAIKYNFDDFTLKIYDLQGIVNFFAVNPIGNPFNINHNRKNLAIVEMDIYSPSPFVKQYTYTWKDDELCECLIKNEDFDETVGHKLCFQLNISDLNQKCYKEKI